LALRFFAPAGGVVSHVRDLRKLARAILFGDDLLSSAARDAMQARVRLPNGSQSAGFGWISERNGVQWHNGQTFGSKAMVAFDVAQSHGIIALWDVAGNVEDICFHALNPKQRAFQGAGDGRTI
jgi:hypothetical protein